MKIIFFNGELDWYPLAAIPILPLVIGLETKGRIEGELTWFKQETWISQGTLGDWTDSTGRLDSTKETGDRKSLREELGGKTSLDSNKKDGDGMSAMGLSENVVNQNIAIKWWTWWLTKPHFYLCSLIWFQGSNRNPPIFAARRCCKWTRLLADGAVRTWWKSSNGWRTQSFFQMADSWMMGWIEIPMI